MKTRMGLVAVATVLVLACVFTPTQGAFYLPGVAPTPYRTRERVPMYVNKITSTKAQLPFRYYDLPFCKPKGVKSESLNLGQLLSGDSIESSDYMLYMKYHEYCKKLCVKVFSDKEAKKFASKIKNEYTGHWILDNLPAAVRFVDAGEDVAYQRGFPLGYVDESGVYIYNHIRFIIQYNEEDQEPDHALIVGFQVEPYSVHHTYEGLLDEDHFQLTTCNAVTRVKHTMARQRIDRGGEVIFTYDVKWEASSTKWANRWQVYLSNTSDDNIHWFSITNSVLVVLLLTCMVAMIMVRVVCKDIARYNDDTALEEAAEETGWKLVHGDVFRPPAGYFGPIMLSVFVGSGVQLVMMTASVMVFAILGFLSPANRGGLLTALLLLYVLNGAAGGYCSARLYKMFDGTSPTRTTLLTAVGFPSVIFSIAFVVNLFVWSAGSSSAIPISTMFSLLALWLGVSTPLVFLGAFFGYRKDKAKQPVRVKQIARAIPEQPVYFHPLIMSAVGGVLPFGAVFIELFFIMSSIWEEQTYYVFGFLLLSLIILVVTCAEVSIVMVYFLLCSENHRWWWRAYITSGSSAILLFLYSIVYFFTNLNLTIFVAQLMYFGYMAMVSIAFFLLTGSVGFMGCLMFVRTIYGALKIE